jgi:hypothetical protein
MGIDYDSKSVYLMQHSLYPLLRLHKEGVIVMQGIKVYVSPTGKGWHVRFSVLTPPFLTRREIELLGGDDMGRHVVGILRGDMDALLFDSKRIEGKDYEEKYAPQITKRIKEMFRRGW